jgi:hypothetical protein
MAEPPARGLTVLAVDGGGIRGLIPALTVQALEDRLTPAGGPRARLADFFDLFVGTSTGGLVALGLNAVDAADPDGGLMTGATLERIYREEGPAIFRSSLARRVVTLAGWTGPKYADTELERVLRRHFGSATMAAAHRDVVAVAYDMTARTPRFFKSARARESPERDVEMVSAAMATACGPTYFPSFAVGGDAMVDGGVFAANPTIAAVAEALKGPGRPGELFVVSLGTGAHEPATGFAQREVRGWGRLGWVWPRRGGPPLLDVILDGQSEAADHWAHMIVNQPGDAPDPAQIGRGPRYFRFQARLPRPYAMDAALPQDLAGLTAAARAMLEERAQELDAVAAHLRAPRGAAG